MSEVDDCPSSADTKYCSICERDRPLDDFALNRSKPDGRQANCRTCIAARRKCVTCGHHEATHNVGSASCRAAGCKCATFVRRPRYEPPPIEAVPEEFEVRAVSTLVDENGGPEKQWIEAKPEVKRAPVIATLPPGHFVKGVSTLVDGAGKVLVQWQKTATDKERFLEALNEALRGLADAWPTPHQIVDPPALVDSDLLCVYPMGDPHVGMFSWGLETGDNFDLKIAESTLCNAVDQLVAGAPPAREALIINIGDFFHADNQSNQTSRSHHQLDVDSRWAKVLRVGVRALRRCIDRALEKHERVRVICEIGNHDDHSSVFLAMGLELYYEHDPRVEIDTSPAKFHWHRFGANLIGTTHGDTVKLSALPGIMACDRKVDWGETEYRHWYTGHVHHDEMHEFPGCTVETLRTLASRDAWHASKGYRSGQDMKLDVWHRQWGHIQRNRVGIARIRAALAA